LNDVQDALAYLREHADALNIDVNKMVVGGDSAG
jgi:acetyl esterase/lipase